MRLIFYNELNRVTDNKVPRCDYISEIIGSQGHWYDYLFISNADLTQDALNDIYNKTDKLGADVVYIINPATIYVVFRASGRFWSKAQCAGKGHSLVKRCNATPGPAWRP